MTAFACFLRGVNVGGKGKMPMAELRAVLEALGYSGIQTVLQSGNAVFAAKGAKASVAKAVDAAIEKRFKRKFELYLLAAPELRAIVDGNPFPAEAKKDPSHLIVRLASKALDAGEQRRLAETAVDGELFKVTPHALYMFYPHGIARSKLGSTLKGGTGRNWNTLTKMLELAEAL